MTTTPTSHTVSLYVTVHDEQLLWDAARARYVDDAEDDGAAEIMLGTRDEPDVSGCLRMLADPGVSWPGTQIEDSSCD